LQEFFEKLQSRDEETRNRQPDNEQRQKIKKRDRILSPPHKTTMTAEEEEEWTTLKHQRETNVPPSLSSYEEEEEEDGTTCVSSVSEAIDIALRAFESRAEMYSRVKRAHGDVLERVRRGERGESSSSVAFVEYEKSLAAFASDMNELNGKLKHVLQYLAREEEEEKEEEDEKRVCFQLLKSVQEQEKEKLRLTTVEMALKTHYEMKNWSWQQDGYVEEEEEREEREEEKENASSASALKPSWATYVDGEKNDAYEGQRKCCEEAPEPTKIEFENAMKETTVGLENCIQTINDAREELLEIKASFLSL
jgi:hypothetical protein